MEKPRIYNLGTLQRRFHYPFRLEKIGWMPHHIYWHRGTVLSSMFICFSSNQSGTGRAVYNGVLRDCIPQGPTLGILLPGTRIETIEPVYHDELFFEYLPEFVPQLIRFLGTEACPPHLSCPHGFPEDIIADIRKGLNRLEDFGAADRIDQLAIRLFSETLLRSGTGEQTLSPIRMKLHTIAAGLRNGQALKKQLREHGLSERTFYREWSKVFSVSPAQYRLNNALAEAAKLLKTTELCPTEIAGRCGFSSTIYFYQRFREHYKLPPLRYRQESRTHLL